MTLRAWLTGHELDLQPLCEQFPEGDPAVLRADDGRCYVESSKIGTAQNGPDHDAARRLVEQLNGIMRVLEAGFHPVTAGSYSSTDGTQIFAFDAAHAESRGSATAELVTASGETVPPPPPRGARYLALAGRDPDVDEAMHFLAQPGKQLTWVDLFKVYEIVEKAAGGTGPITGRGWASAGDLDRFGKSANHPAVSGSDAARHARMDGTPTAGISLAEANEFIRKLVTCWVEAHPDY